MLKSFVPEFLWPEVVEVDGVKIRIRGSRYSFGIKYFLCRNPDQYEIDERVICKRILNRGDRVLEMGSSIGVLTAIVKNLIGEEGDILSIEADENLVKHNRNAPHLKRCKMEHGYAFPLYESVNLHVEFDSAVGGSLGGQVTYTEAVNKSKNLFFIKDVEKQFDFRPNVLIVDIEGSESIVCKYKANLPEWIRKVVIELHPEIYGVSTMVSVIEKFVSEGFSLVETQGQVHLFER